MAFTRTIEDFTCEHCHVRVKGDGYTNHCPKCLWSKHVDIEPGDRAESCGGMMEPIALEGSSPSYIIVHACVRCAVTRRNRMQSNDSEQALLQLARASRKI